MTGAQRETLLDMAQTLTRRTRDRLAASDGKDLKDLIGCVKELSALYRGLEDTAEQETLRVVFAPELAEWAE